MKAPNHGCLVEVTFRDVEGADVDVQRGHLMLATTMPDERWQFDHGINLRVEGHREPLVLLLGDRVEVIG